MRDSQGKSTGVLTGFSLDLIRMAYARLGREVEFIGDIPWARCQRMVEEGRINFAMDVGYSAERASHFVYSAHYNSPTPYVFFDSQRVVNFDTPAGLRHYHGCGLSDISYEQFGIDTSELDLGVKSYEALIRKLRDGRCDYFIEYIETAYGYKAMGEDWFFDPELRHVPLANGIERSLHLITALNGPDARKIGELNAEINYLINSGAAATLWRRHAGDLPYRP